MDCTEEAVKAALSKHGSIKSFGMKTKQENRGQYANVVCYQKHICEALIAASSKAMPIRLKNGRVIDHFLSIQYHNQQRVNDAREKYEKRYGHKGHKRR